MDITPHLARVIREALTAQNKSILNLSETTGIPYATLHRKLNGLRPLYVNELGAIAEQIGADPAALITDANSQAAA